MSAKALRSLAIAMQAGQSTVVKGGPGIGKSSGMGALARAIESDCFETVIASLREPADFAGLPHVTPNGVELAPPAWARRLATSKRGILFIDEISTAAPAVQAALLRVILDRVVGDITLPDTVSIVAAMNEADQAAGGWELAPPLANRFCHLEWRVNVGEWVEGMMSDFPMPTFPILPEGWRSGIRESRLLVASFIQHKQTSLYVLPKNDAEAGKPWPSPRSWTMAATLSAACKAANAGLDVELPLIAGCVGDGHALEFTNWRDALDLPDPESILKAPKDFTCPDRGDKAYTVLASVASAVVNNMSKTRLVAAWTVFKLAADAGKKDMGAAAVRTLAQAMGKESFMSDPEVRKAMVENLKPYIDILKQARLF